MTPPETIAAIDVGNSAIKVALANVSDLTADALDLTAQGGVVAYQTFPLDQPNWDTRVRQWVQQQAGRSRVAWWVSTVNHAASRPLRDAVCGDSQPPREAQTPLQTGDRQAQWHSLSYQDVPLQIAVDGPEKVGLDRLLSAYAASNRFAPPLVVVDAGSAVTVDCVRPGDDGRPVFVGGAILPGIRLQHAVLVTGTEGLQQVSGGIAPDAVGSMTPATNTRQAIRLGVLAAVAGGVERLAREYARAQDKAVAPEHADSGVSFPIVLCGGDASTISPYLRVPHQSVPNLVCLGILDLAIRQCQMVPSGLK